MTNEPVVAIVADAMSGAGTLGVLRDWSAVGLIRPFLWVATTPGRTVLVTDGRAVQATVERHLADVGHPSVVRVCALDLLNDADIVPTAASVIERVEDATPATPVTRLHAVPTAMSIHDARALQVTYGWHVVVLPPQDSFSPAAAGEVVSAQDGDTTRLEMLVAAQLAGFLGLWNGLPESPLDDKAPPPGAQAVFGRAYFRRRNAHSVGNDILRRMTDLGGGLPQPLSNGEPMPAIEDETGAAHNAADALLAVHAWVLKSKREQVVDSQSKKIGLREGLRMLLSFVWAAVRNAPRDWYHRAVASVSTRVAGMGQSLAFGEGSNFEIVIHGRLASGKLATWAQIDEAIGSVGKDIDLPGHHERVDHVVALWQDFIAVGLSLADGQQRARVTPPTSEGRPAVIRTSSRIAPSPDAAFASMPAHVAAALGVETVQPADTALCSAIETELTEQAGNSAIALDLGRARDGLAEWQRTVQLPNYAGRVGHRLDSQMMNLRQEIDSLHSTLARVAGAIEADDDLERRQDRLARRMRITIIIMVVLLVCLGVAGFADWISWGRALIGGFFVTFTGCISLAILFFLGQRELFAHLNRRRQDLERRDVLRRNLAAAVADLRRVTRAYRQYLCWATVLGAFIERPFGPPPEPVVELPLLDGALPRSVQIGHVTAAALTVATMAETCIRSLTTAGWLSDPWETLMSHAHEYSATPGGAHSDPDQLFGDSCTTAQSPLVAFADDLRRHGVRRHAADRLWARVEPLLTGPQLERARAELLSGTQWAGERSTPAGESVDWGDPKKWRPFDGSALRADSIARNVLQADQTRTHTSIVRVGLSESVCLTQVSRVFPADELGLGGSRSGPRDTGSVDYI